MATKNGDNNHKISTFEIQLEEKNEQNGNHKDLSNGVRVIIAKECCLTCGGVKRMQWIERVDGKKEIKEACLFCVTKTTNFGKPFKVVTAANRRNH
jgi:hypothetical protein